MLKKTGFKTIKIENSTGYGPIFFLYLNFFSNQKVFFFYFLVFLYSVIWSEFEFGKTTQFLFREKMQNFSLNKKCENFPKKCSQSREFHKFFEQLTVWGYKLCLAKIVFAKFSIFSNFFV